MNLLLVRLNSIFPSHLEVAGFLARACVSMAPAISIGIAVPASGGKRRGTAAAEAVALGEAELLRRRNAELEREVAALRAELEAARRRAETAEEAEERLCVQLGETEVEAVELARAYQGRVDELARELAVERASAGDGGRGAHSASRY